MTAALDARGLKRICMSCGTRFYDMNKRPVVCPSCETEFTGEIKVKTRRSRASVANDPIREEKNTAKGQQDDSDIEEKDDDTISLDEVDEGSDDEDEDLDLDIGGDLENIDDMDDDMDDDDEDLDIGVVDDDD